MRTKLIVVATVLAALALISGSKAGSRPGSDMVGVVGSKASFGNSPDRSRRTTAEIVGFDRQGGIYVQGASSIWDWPSSLFRFRADGTPDESFNRRIKLLIRDFSSVAVVGDRILVAKDKRLRAFTPEGNVDTNFGNNGEIVVKRLPRQIVAYGESSFYLVLLPERTGKRDVFLKHYTSSGQLLASGQIQPGEMDFEIKDVSATGELAFVTRFPAGVGGGPDTRLYTLDPILDAKTIGSVANVHGSDRFQDVHFLPGGGLVVSDLERATAFGLDEDKAAAFGEGGDLRCLPAEGLDQDRVSPSLTTVDRAGRIIGLSSYGLGGCGVQRFTTDGKPDLDFDRVSASSGLAGQSAPLSDVATFRERILVAWWDLEHGGPGLLAIKESGETDTSFGSMGKTYGVSTLPDSSYATDSTSDVRGRILVAGANRSADSLSGSLALARFRRDGTSDRRFGLNGRMKIDLGSTVTSASLTRLKSGEIMVSGALGNGRLRTSGYLLRLTADGQLDREFGEEGLLVVNLPHQRSTSFLAARAFGQGLLVAGSVCCSKHGQDALVAAFDTDGNLVDSFGDGGLVIRDLQGAPAPQRPGGDLDRAVALDLDRSGGPVVFAETTPRGSFPKSVGFGLRADGRRSRLFRHRVIDVPAFRVVHGAHGKRKRRAMKLWPEGVKVLSRDSILYTMAREDLDTYPKEGSSSTVGHMTVLDRAGRLVRGFGKGGQVNSRSLSFRDVALDRCGRIMVGGASPNPKKPVFSFGLARYQANGHFAGASRPNGYRLGGSNSLEIGTALTVTGNRAFLSGNVKPPSRPSRFGFIGFRAKSRCR